MDIDFGKPGPRVIARLGAVVLVIGALLDTISNALSIVSARWTYIGTAVALLALPLLWLLEKMRILTLRHQSGRVLRPLDGVFVGSVLAVLLVLWLPRIFEANPIAVADLLTQREVLEIQGPKAYEVFYPRPFSSVPNLNFSKMVNNVYFHVEYDVIEQRPDGFKIVVSNAPTSGALEWIAVGIVDKKDATSR